MSGVVVVWLWSCGGSGGVVEVMFGYGGRVVKVMVVAVMVWLRVLQPPYISFT